MSTQFKIEHEFDIPLDTFEKNLNHPKLNKMLESELGFEKREMVEKNTDEEGNTSWEFLVQKGGDLPGPLKSVLKGESISWREVSRFVPDEHCIYWEIKPSSKILKFSGKGTWQLEGKGPGFRRTIEGDISINIPFVGKVIEGLIVKELTSTYEREPKIQEKFFSKIA